MTPCHFVCCFIKNGHEIHKWEEMKEKEKPKESKKSTYTEW